jgi:two-component system, OmpR family, response regulator
MKDRDPIRILVVEDEPVIGAAARLALEEVGGFTVEVCDSGIKTIDATRRFRPDLILLDAVMPGMDGPETLAALRREDDLSALPVVFMTGRTHPSEIEHFRSLGALGVIPKPIDPFELPDRVLQFYERPHG